MTIAVGCLCGDGLILGADTQLTSVGFHKSYGRKIDAIDNNRGVDACIAYSGSPVFASDFTDSLLEKIHELGDSADVADARTMVIGVLSRYVESDVNNNNLLIGVRIHDMVALMRTSGYSVSLQSKDQPAFVGAGDSSALASILPLVSKRGTVNMQHGAVLAMLLIEVAKKYVDGCGGDTDILMVPSVGEITFLGMDAIYPVQNEFSDINRVLGTALSTVLLPDSTEEDCDKVIDKLAEELRLTNRVLKNALRMLDPKTSEESS